MAALHFVMIFNHCSLMEGEPPNGARDAATHREDPWKVGR